MHIDEIVSLGRFLLYHSSIKFLHLIGLYMLIYEPEDELYWTAQLQGKSQVHALLLIYYWFYALTLRSIFS